MKKLLYFQVGDIATSGMIRLLADQNGFQANSVSPDEIKSPLGFLFGLPNYPGSAFPVLPVKEPMLVFLDEDGESTQNMLSALRKSGISIGLKAMLTKTNADWTPGRLARELSRERDAFQKLQNEKNGE